MPLVYVLCTYTIDSQCVCGPRLVPVYTHRPVAPIYYSKRQRAAVTLRLCLRSHNSGLANIHKHHYQLNRVRTILLQLVVFNMAVRDMSVANVFKHNRWNINYAGSA